MRTIMKVLLAVFLATSLAGCCWAPWYGDGPYHHRHYGGDDD